MRKEREDRLEQGQPTLIVTYGNTTRKHRPLDRDVTVLGRAPGCDIGLESPEVAPVHCLIVRVQEGWRLRDCSGRLGTRLNGRTARDELLHDEDVLQVGTFSFKLYLPPDAQAAAVPPSKQELIATPSASSLTPGGPPGATTDLVRGEIWLDRREAELDRREENLGALQRDCDERLSQLKQLERDLADGRAALDQDRTALRAQAESERRQLAAERSSLERERTAVPAEPEARPPALTPVPEGVTSPSPDLESRRAELDAFARHLLQTREMLRRQAEELAADRAQFHAEREGAETYDHEHAQRYEVWRQEQGAAAKEYEWRRETLAKEMAELREQRSQVVRMLGELREARRSAQGAPA
jgi:pSer/pThr/pTyr-binding forkhead associated (FHA) protein